MKLCKSKRLRLICCLKTTEYPQSREYTRNRGTCESRHLCITVEVKFCFIWTCITVFWFGFCFLQQCKNNFIGVLFKWFIDSDLTLYTYLVKILWDVCKPCWSGNWFITPHRSHSHSDSSFASQWNSSKERSCRNDGIRTTP